MLHLRVFGDTAAMADVAERLDALPGARHVSVGAGVHKGDALVSADLRAAAADTALEILDELGIAHEDISLLRFDAIDPNAASEETVALVWADLLGQARLNARTAIRYLVFMAVAGVIAGFGVIDRDQILIVGAMAVAPDLLPVTAACTGLVLRRWHLVSRGLGALAAGLFVAGLVAGAVTALLNLFHGLPHDFVLKQVD